MKSVRRRGNVARPSGLRRLVIECLEDRRLMTITANYYPDYAVLKVMASADEPLVIGADDGIVTINGEASVDGISGLAASSVDGLWIVGNSATTPQEADDYFFGIGVQPGTPTSIPGNR